MVVKKQPIISWLLGGHPKDFLGKVGVAGTPNANHFGYLSNGFNSLAEIQQNNPEWGLPELVMPSFEEVMKKSAKSFYNIDHQLFKEFYKDNECGIILSKDWGTVVYGFGDNQLYVWLFMTHPDGSKLYLYFYVKSTENNTRQIYTWPTLLDDKNIFYSNNEERKHIYEYLTNFIISYLAVKKYVEVETVVIDPGTTSKLDDTIFPYQRKEKVRNDSGQKVIVMDSRWFRKIVNDNDIFVRGFFRLQNKKNDAGEWYKELIFVDSFVRHGYHRNAKIEDADKND